MSETKPLANVLANKKLRVRKCGARLRMPSETPGRETVYTCQLEKHPVDVPHQEIGFVLMHNQTARKYTVSWTDEGVAQLRQQARNTRPKPKVRLVQ